MADQYTGKNLLDRLLRHYGLPGIDTYDKPDGREQKAMVDAQALLILGDALNAAYEQGKRDEREAGECSSVSECPYVPWCGDGVGKCRRAPAIRSRSTNDA